MENKSALILGVVLFGLIFWKNWESSSLDLPLVQQPTRNSQMKSVHVVRVVDGDTIICKMNDGVNERIRLIGVDTPETVHPRKKKQYYGQEASDYTKQVLENASVVLEFENELRDRYGRLLAHVWIRGNNFQKMLLEGGYARAVFYHPNVKYRSEYTQYETSARNRGIGLWNQ